MIRIQHVGLHLEKVFWIPEMRPECLRHRGDRSDQRREHARIRQRDWVGRVDQVEGHGPVVRIDGDLHAVPDVVVDPRHRERGGNRLTTGTCRTRRVWRRTPGNRHGIGVGPSFHGSLGIRVPVRRRVRVNDPNEATIRRDDVGIAIQLQEWRESAYAIPDSPAHEQLAVGSQVAARKHVEIAEVPRQGKPSPPRRHPDATRPGIGREDVLVAPRVVKLLGLGVHHHVTRCLLTEVDLRAVNRDGTRWGNVLHHEIRHPFRGHLVHGADNHTIPMRILQTLVHPRLSLRT